MILDDLHYREPHLNIPKIKQDCLLQATGKIYVLAMLFIDDNYLSFMREKVGLYT